MQYLQYQQCNEMVNNRLVISNGRYNNRLDAQTLTNPGRQELPRGHIRLESERLCGSQLAL
jgi:hypothetical protein